MAKKQKNIDTVHLSQEEYECFKKMTNQINSQTTVMRVEANKLKKQATGYFDMEREVTALKGEKISFNSRILKLEKKLDKEVATRDGQIEELTVRNKELQTELDIRIQEDNRFNNLDL